MIIFYYYCSVLRPDAAVPLCGRGGGDRAHDVLRGHRRHQTEVLRQELLEGLHQVPVQCKLFNYF